MRVGIIICAAGKGSRVGGDTPKQFIKIGGLRIVDYTIISAIDCGKFDDVVVVIRPGHEKEYSFCNGRVKLVYGDTEDGQNSRRLGLNYLKDELGYCDDDLVAVMDGNRPFVFPDFYEVLIEEAKKFGNAIPYIIQKDILVREKDGRSSILEFPRSEIKATLAPIVFRFGEFWDVYDEAYKNGTLKDSEGAITLLLKRLMKEGRDDELHYVKGDVGHFKITTPDDVHLAEMIMS